MDKNKRNANIAIIILILILGLVLFLGYKNDQRQKTNLIEQINEMHRQEEEKLKQEEIQRKKQQEEEARLAEIERINNLSGYEKIKEGRDINILIIGDSVTLGNRGDGSTNHWYNSVGQWIKDTYNATAYITIAENPEDNITSVNNSYINDTTKYDIVIIGLGSSGNEKTDPGTFNKMYGDLINKIKSKNNRCNIINISPVNINGDTAYSPIIREISNNSGSQIVDLGTIFHSGNINVNEIILQDGIYPTDVGYTYYSNTIADIIKNN